LQCHTEEIGTDERVRLLRMMTMPHHVEVVAMASAIATIMEVVENLVAGKLAVAVTGMNVQGIPAGALLLWLVAVAAVQKAADHQM